MSHSRMSDAAKATIVYEILSYQETESLFYTLMPFQHTVKAGILIFRPGWEKMTLSDPPPPEVEIVVS